MGIAAYRVRLFNLLINTTVSTLGYNGKLKSVFSCDLRFRLVQMTDILALLCKGTEVCLLTEVIGMSSEDL